MIPLKPLTLSIVLTIGLGQPAMAADTAGNAVFSRASHALGCRATYRNVLRCKPK